MPLGRHTQGPPVDRTFNGKQQRRIIGAGVGNIMAQRGMGKVGRAHGRYCTAGSGIFPRYEMASPHCEKSMLQRADVVFIKEKALS
jgi:hypothetical protein